MTKAIGIFELHVARGGHPVWITIKDDRGNEIRISHKDLADLSHLVSEAKKAAYGELPENYRHEV